MQVDQATKLAEEGLKTISAIDDPSFKLLIIFFIFFISGSVYAIYKLFNMKIKDIEEEKEKVKKKDEIIEAKSDRFENLLVKNIETTMLFSNNVSNLTNVLQQISVVQQQNTDSMREHHELLKSGLKSLKIEFSK